MCVCVIQNIHLKHRYSIHLWGMNKINQDNCEGSSYESQGSSYCISDSSRKEEMVKELAFYGYFNINLAMSDLFEISEILTK